MKAANLFLIDNNRLFREGLKRLFRGSSFTIVGEASTLTEGVSFLKMSGVQPGLIVMDVQSITEQEISALQAYAPEARLVILSTDLNTTLLSDALRAGVHGYLVKDIACESLIQSLQLVLLGEKVFPTNLAELLMSGMRGTITLDKNDRKGLSERDKQILRCLLNGNSNKMIANHLRITEATVKVHLKSLLRKIKAANRTQAAIWAMNNGMMNEKADLAAV